MILTGERRAGRSGCRTAGIGPAPPPFDRLAPGSYAPTVPDLTPAPDRWALRPIPPEPRSIVELIGSGVLDAELAAILWLLVEGLVPVVVAGDGPGTGRSTLLRALLDFLPSGIRVVELKGQDEDFAWLPQASELGWPGRPLSLQAQPPIRPESTVLFVDELSDRLPAFTWGTAARIEIGRAHV